MSGAYLYSLRCNVLLCSPNLLAASEILPLQSASTRFICSHSARASDGVSKSSSLPRASSSAAPEKARRRVADLFKSGFTASSDWNDVVLFVQDYGGIEYSMEKARVYGERAKDCLGRISPSPERDALHLAADYIVDRIIPFSG